MCRWLRSYTLLVFYRYRGVQLVVRLGEEGQKNQKGYSVYATLPLPAREYILELASFSPSTAVTEDQVTELSKIFIGSKGSATTHLFLGPVRLLNHDC